MGFFTNVIWVIATFFLFIGVLRCSDSLFEDDLSVPFPKLLAVVALLVVFVSYSSHKWAREQGGVSAALGLVVSKVAKPVSKEVEKFKEGYNR